MTSEHEHHVALPKLYGAPAHHHRAPVAVADRPLDADDLPLAVEMTDEERAYAKEMLESGQSGQGSGDAAHHHGRRGPAHRARAIARRIFRPVRPAKR